MKKVWMIALVLVLLFVFYQVMNKSGYTKKGECKPIRAKWKECVKRHHNIPSPECRKIFKEWKECRKNLPPNTFMKPLQHHPRI